MSPIDWMKLALSRYSDFSGRSRRMEYWMFVLMQIGISIVTSLVDNIIGLGGVVFGFYGPLTTIILLALIVPGIAVGVRRLHDRDMSGWFLLLGFVPIIGGLALLVIFLLEGTNGPNKYGPDPKAS